MGRDIASRRKKRQSKKELDSIANKGVWVDGMDALQPSDSIFIR